MVLSTATMIRKEKGILNDIRVCSFSRSTKRFRVSDYEHVILKRAERNVGYGKGHLPYVTIKSKSSNITNDISTEVSFGGT